MRPATWLAAMMAFALSAAAQSPPVSEATVKAAFILKFGGYVEWPAHAFATPESPIVIGVMGNDEVAAELEKLAPDRVVAGRRVEVRRVKPGDALKGVLMLFVGRGEPAMRTVIRAAQQQGVLAITESEQGLEAGSAINFVVADDRVGFEVSLKAAESSGLRISARMLTVARRVIARQ